MARRIQATLSVPSFSSLADEAAFWETNNPLDYPGEWVEEERPPHALGHILGVRLDAATLEKLTNLARAKGFGPSMLARMWILERLQSSP